MDSLLQSIYDSIVAGNAEGAKAGVRAALEAKLEPATIVNAGMITAMKEVGRRFECGDYYTPEMLIAARAMQGGMALLKPYLLQSHVKSAGKVVIGTVKGDLHDIGKNLVSVMLEGAGFEIIDLGVDVPVDKFVDAVRAQQPDLLALSALLTTTMPLMTSTLAELTKAGLRDKVKVMVGGAPVTEAYAKHIGADGFSPDASRAVGVAKALVDPGPVA